MRRRNGKQGGRNDGGVPPSPGESRLGVRAFRCTSEIQRSFHCAVTRRKTPPYPVTSKGFRNFLSTRSRVISLSAGRKRSFQSARCKSNLESPRFRPGTRPVYIYEAVRNCAEIRAVYIGNNFDLTETEIRVGE